MIDKHSRRRYEVRHLTEYNYEEDVTKSFARAMLRPRETASQRVETHTIEIRPEPDVLDEWRDAFGNYAHYVEISEPHTTLTVTKLTIFDVEWPQTDLDELDRWTIAEAAEALRESAEIDHFEVSAYSMPSQNVTLGECEREFAAKVLSEDMGLGTAIRTMYERIYEDFKYTSGATTVTTTLPEIIAAQEGVCQDFAHLAIACFRAFRIPAKYVSGYIETYPPPGKEKLEGSDASHAWASVLAPDGRWVDFDPTNNQLADSRYVVTAWGRDFRDVSPLKGIIFTDGSGSTLKVAVDVKMLDD